MQERWGMFASTIATVLIVPLWLPVTWWFSHGYSDYWWDSRCYEGAPTFVLVQTTLGMCGPIAGLAASVGTYVAARRGRRAPSILWLGFGTAAVCLVAWVAVVANQPPSEPCGA